MNNMMQPSIVVACLFWFFFFFLDGDCFGIEWRINDMSITFSQQILSSKLLLFIIIRAKK